MIERYREKRGQREAERDTKTDRHRDIDRGADKEKQTGRERQKTKRERKRDIVRTEKNVKKVPSCSLEVWFPRVLLYPYTKIPLSLLLLT